MIKENQFVKKNVVITGASSGIGAALAELFAKRGANVVLAARRMDRLQKISKRIEENYNVKALAVECDVTSEGDLESLVEKCVQELGSVDIIVANAGFGLRGPFDRLRVRDFQRQFETNVFGVLKTIYAALKELKKSKGHIVIVGSVMGHIALPFLAPYTMSKFALRGLSLSIRDELSRDGVKVTLVSPGLVESEMRQVDSRGLFNANLQDRTPKWLCVATESAANEIINAILNNEAERVVTAHGQILVLLNRYFPFLINLLKKIYIHQLTNDKKLN